MAHQEVGISNTTDAIAPNNPMVKAALRKRPEPKILENGRFECVECGKSLKNWTSYRVHSNKSHGNFQRANIRCWVDECKLLSTTVAVLANHLDEMHDYRMEFIEQEFDGVSEFEEFLHFLNNDRSTSFVRKHGAKPGSSSVMYHCNRSRHCSDSEVTSTTGVSLKVVRYCPAHIVKTNLVNGRILIRGQLRHVGHEIDMKYIPLSAKICSDIEGMLLLGLRPNQIVRRIRNEIVMDSNKRDYHVTTTDVRRIAKKLAKREGHSASNGVASDEYDHPVASHPTTASTLHGSHITSTCSANRSADKGMSCNESICSNEGCSQNIHTSTVSLDAGEEKDTEVSQMNAGGVQNGVVRRVVCDGNGIGKAKRLKEASKSSNKFEEVMDELVASCSQLRHLWKRCAERTEARTAKDELIEKSKANLCQKGRYKRKRN